MPIDYSGTVFRRIGKIIKASNAYVPIAATTLLADLQSIVAVYGGGSSTTGIASGPIQGIDKTYSGFQSNVVTWRTTLQRSVEKTLTDYDTVLSQLSPIPPASGLAVLAALLLDMNINNQTVQRCNVTVGSVTAGAKNVGTGTVLVDKILDGFTPPIQGGMASTQYAGLASELAVNETMTLLCTSDSKTSGGTEGAEQWQWTGGLLNGNKYPPFAWQGEGSGSATIQTANNDSSILQNLGFTSFSSNTPGSWTIDLGTAGTNIFQETTTTFRGGSAFRFTGDGTTATLQISQAVNTNSIKSRQRYAATFMVYRSGNAPGGGSLNINFTGTGYTASASEKISLLYTAIPANVWTLYSFYVTAPVNPTAWKLQIQAVGTLANGANIILDSGTCTFNRYHGGVSVLPLAGITPYSIGDQFNFTLSNDNAGIFQTYLRKSYAVQLLSTAGVPTISDNLAL